MSSEIKLAHWPADSRQISSAFGMRVHPVTKVKKTHQGIDIKPLKGPGEPIYAAADGTVSVAKANRNDPRTGYGWYVVIDHGGWCTIYAHQLEGIPVKCGQKVKAGDVIGKIGNSGCSTGAHLHFGVARGAFKAAGSDWIDPVPLLSRL